MAAANFAVPLARLRRSAGATQQDSRGSDPGAVEAGIQRPAAVAGIAGAGHSLRLATLGYARVRIQSLTA